MSDLPAVASEQVAGTVDELRACTGLPFFAVRIDSRCVVEVAGQLPPMIPDCVREELQQLTHPKKWETNAGMVFYAVPFCVENRTRYAALGYIPSAKASVAQVTRCEPPADLIIAGSQAGWSARQLRHFWNECEALSGNVVERLITLAAEHLSGRSARLRLEDELDHVTCQLDHTYEEISLLHDLSRNLQVSQGPTSLADLCVRRLHALVDAGGSLILINDRSRRNLLHSRGVLPFEPRELETLIESFSDVEWSRPLVRNHVGKTLLGADYPRLSNFILVPIQEGQHRKGWVFCCNRTHGQEFGTVEAGFMNSVATILGTHVRNTELYQQNQDLLIGFVRSLVSSLDAKDPYTRGHSERVALIARRIGKHMKLPEGDLRDIYLSGLLHDVGKIGIDDRILRKPGRLTDAEFEAVKAHPTIGYNILKGLSNLQHILPGVRNHHENFDGTGYPDKLAGDDIPLMARILAVADGYDAMGSDRPYRKGMPNQKIEEIFRKGRNEQWDPNVIDAYFACREDILNIYATYSLEAGAPIDGSLSTISLDR
ncbi:HD-GYP domain-containing protein [Stratiformator vulcanicus]|nr:HD-GYP domain-containing protein [Stratiformator vulcanicus]